MPKKRNKSNISVANRLQHYPHLDEKRERNEQIVRDYLNDVPIVDMVAKYRITPSRIYKIVDGYRWVGAKEQWNDE